MLYVTEEQRRRRPIFIATLRAARLLAGCFVAHRSKTTAGILPLRFAHPAKIRSSATAPVTDLVHKDRSLPEAPGEWRPMWDLNLSVLRFTFAPLRLCVRFFLRLPFCAFRLRFQIQAQAAEKAPYPWCDESCWRSATAACSAFGQGRPSSRYNWINRSDLSLIERRMACENPFLIDGFHFSV
jgi:hypothetical protein